MTHKRVKIKVNGTVHTVNPLKQHLEVLWIRQSGHCMWCGLPMVRKTMRNENGSMDGRKATIDHLVSQAAGGSDDISNLVAACHSCNQLRGDNNTLYLGDRIKRLVAIVTNLNKICFQMKVALERSQEETKKARFLAKERLIEVISLREKIVEFKNSVHNAPPPTPCTPPKSGWRHKIFSIFR